MFANNIMIPMILYNMNIAGYLSRRDEENDVGCEVILAPLAGKERNKKHHVVKPHSD